MRRSVLQYVAVDGCLPLTKLAPTLVRLIGAPATTEGGYPVSEKLDIETRMSPEGHLPDMSIMDVGQPSPYTCPACHGVLAQLQDGRFTRFRCHTGRAYTLSSLLADVTESLETSLWNTLRAMEESVTDDPLTRGLCDILSDHPTFR
jgi:two-component system chemotaxis response regulator CheB